MKKWKPALHPHHLHPHWNSGAAPTPPRPHRLPPSSSAGGVCWSHPPGCHSYLEEKRDGNDSQGSNSQLWGGIRVGSSFLCWSHRECCGLTSWNHIQQLGIREKCLCPAPVPSQSPGNAFPPGAQSQDGRGISSTDQGSAQQAQNTGCEIPHPSCPRRSHSLLPKAAPAGIGMEKLGTNPTPSFGF